MADTDSEYQRLQAAWDQARIAGKMTRGRLYRQERRALRELLDYVDGELLTGTMLDPRTWPGGVPSGVPFDTQTMDDLEADYLMEFSAGEFPSVPRLAGYDWRPCLNEADVWKCNLAKGHAGPHMANGPEWLCAMWPREGRK